MVALIFWYFEMGKYVLKRLALMLFTLIIIVSICFLLVRLLPREFPQDKNQEQV